jgi:hypothetical protein
MRSSLIVALCLFSLLAPVQARPAREGPEVRDLRLQLATLCKQIGVLAEAVARQRETVPVTEAFDRLMTLDPRYESIYLSILQRVYADPLYFSVRRLQLEVEVACVEQLTSELRAAQLLPGEKK